MNNRVNIKIFFLLISVILSILPIVNIFSGGFTKENLTNTKFLYSLDVIEGKINPYLVPLGVSIKPNSVVVGKDGWFFLGDDHQKTISAYRTGFQTVEVQERSAVIIESQTLWKKYFQKNGVTDYKILVGPNKSTIYNEYLPLWAKTSSESISHTLYDNDIYIDIRHTISDVINTQDLYYKTDTHWNYYGAGVAFNEFMLRINNEGLVLPPLNWSNVIRNDSYIHGDLTRFLRVGSLYSDPNPITEANNLQLSHIISDYNKDSVVYKGTAPLYGHRDDLYLITTPKALNNKKVLWLSDSYGNALAPYMTATFSHILKQNWSKLLGTQALEQLIQEWKPDYVFVTVVERYSLDDLFQARPPIQP